MKLIIALLLTGVMCACSSSADKKQMEVMMAGFDENSNKKLETDQSSNSVSKDSYTSNEKVQKNAHRKIIWNGSLQMQVKNVEEATTTITEIVKKNGGFISDMQTTNNATQKSNLITIRIDRNQFQSTITSLKKEAVYLKSANIHSEDVTEEFVDIESRLKTKRDVRDRYIQVLRTKAGSVKDIIEAEEAIRIITEEIEVQEGRMRYLNDRIDLSTIDVEIYQTVKHTNEPIVYEESYGSKLASGFESGWNAVQGFFLGLITIWPLMIVLASIVFWKRKWLRSLYKK